MYQYFIPICCWIIFHYVDRPHLFIHSSVEGHLGCVHLLATVPSAAVNTREQIFEYKFSILWGIYLEAGLLGWGYCLKARIREKNSELQGGQGKIKEKDSLFILTVHGDTCGNVPRSCPVKQTATAPFVHHLWASSDFGIFVCASWLRAISKGTFTGKCEEN